jgi:hypothetical protein
VCWLTRLLVQRLLVCSILTRCVLHDFSNVSTVLEWLSDRVVRWISPNKPAVVALTSGQIEEVDVEKATSAS